MTTFLDLTRPDSETLPGNGQNHARMGFAQKVAQSRFRLWGPGDNIVPHGRRILIGVAPYSMEDMRLLDGLERQLAQQTGEMPRIEVFDVLECKSHEDFAAYVPGLGKVYQTPVVGIWEEGNLKEKAWGAAGRDLLRRTLPFELDPLPR